MDFALTPNNGRAVKIYSGSPKCRRTVVISLIDLPAGGNSNVWFSSDKNQLESGKDSTAYKTGGQPYWGAGIALIDFSGSTTRLPIVDCSTDIYALATRYDAGIVAPQPATILTNPTAIGIKVEAF